MVVMRFDREKTFIHAGETVEWSNFDPTASHTITFGSEPADPMPASGNVTVDSDGARHAKISSPADSVHSGFIVASPQERTGLPQPATRRYEVPHHLYATGNLPLYMRPSRRIGHEGTVIVLP